MKKLHRANPSSIGGVCKGIGNYLNLDETIIKIIFVLLFFTPFPIGLIYLLLWIIIPKETDEENF
jgi:phage shock protein PspC (stress-responsive transcriptional regulator)